MSTEDLLTREDIEANVSPYTRIHYEQVTANKPVAGNDFTGGQIRFRFSPSSWWLPQKTYFHLRAEIAFAPGGNRTAIPKDAMAPNQFFCDTLFESCDVLIEGKSVSRVGEFMPQVKACRERTMKSWAHRSTIGASQNFDIVDFRARNREVSAAVEEDLKLQAANDEDIDKTFTLEHDGEGYDDFELYFQPPCDIFNQGPLPAGNYTIVLTPQQNLLNFSVHSHDFALAHTSVNVKQLHLYVAEVESPKSIPPSFTYYMDLRETRCQIRNIETSQGQIEFSVMPSTFAISTAVQSQSEDTTHPPTRFTILPDEGKGNDVDVVGRALTRLRVQYASQTAPTEGNLELVHTGRVDDNTRGTDYFRRVYHDFIVNTNLMFKEGGAEPYEEFKTQGWIAHYTFMKPANDTSEHAHLTYTFTKQKENMSSDDFANALRGGNFLLFDHHKVVCKIEYRDGRVVSVAREEG